MPLKLDEKKKFYIRIVDRDGSRVKEVYGRMIFDYLPLKLFLHLDTFSEEKEPSSLWGITEFYTGCSFLPAKFDTQKELMDAVEKQLKKIPAQRLWQHLRKTIEKYGYANTDGEENKIEELCKESLKPPLPK